MSKTKLLMLAEAENAKESHILSVNDFNEAVKKLNENNSKLCDASPYLKHSDFCTPDNIDPACPYYAHQRIL